MNFSVDDHNNEKHIALSGSFTFADHRIFKQIMAAIGDKDIKAVTLDFSAVEFIDSGALGMLLLLRDECQSRHIPVALQAAQGQVNKVFMIAKFDQIFSMRRAK
jgi:anti-anti-sigma factor